MVLTRLLVCAFQHQPRLRDHLSTVAPREKLQTRVPPWGERHLLAPSRKKRGQVENEIICLIICI